MENRFASRHKGSPPTQPLTKYVEAIGIAESNQLCLGFDSLKHLTLLESIYSVNIILAGFEQDTGPSLYFIDYIATLHKVDKAAFGYGSYFALS
uniref:Uncharacterized protein n=1 Tax=Chenopodium quinoa TaxID=63459 RepID=A0A803MT24_CHEQI